METAAERKERSIQAILKAHPTYLPESYIAQQAAKAMRRMPEQTLFYLWLLLGITNKYPGRIKEE